MGEKKNKDAWRIVAGGFWATLAIFCGVGCAVEFKYVLTPWWIPVLAAVMVSLALALPMRSVLRWLTGSRNPAIILLCQVFLISPVLLIAALLANMTLASPEREQIATEVTRVYKETRYRTKRVSRRVYTRGAPYKAYRMEIEIPGKGRRSLDISKKIYDRVMKGDTIGINVFTGPLGIRMFESGSFDLRKIRKAEEKREKARETLRERRRRKYNEHMHAVTGRHIDKNREKE